jgi:hypothetical protein
MKKLSIGELVNQVSNLSSLYFGLKEPLEKITLESSIPMFSSYHPIEYYHRVSPADQQTLQSCESNSFCGVIESWINYYHKCKVQLDYNLIYHKAREKFWNDDDSGGLILGQSASVALDLGLLPPDTIIERIPLNLDQIYLALGRGPLQVGYNISDGWRLDNLSKGGAINEDFPLQRNAGHAVALMGLAIQSQIPHHIVLNSWGSYGSMNGFLAMTADYSVNSMLDRPISIIPGKMFADFGGWKKFVKE